MKVRENLTDRQTDRQTDNLSILQNYHQEEDVEASWECQSHSSTDTAPSSSKSSDLTDMSQTTRDTDIDLLSADESRMHEYSLNVKYKGVMGVPITFLDRYCPEQFEIIGASESEGKGFSDGLWHENSGIAQPVVKGKRVYKRLFIRYRY